MAHLLLELLPQLILPAEVGAGCPNSEFLDFTNDVSAFHIPQNQQYSESKTLLIRLHI